MFVFFVYFLKYSGQSDLYLTVDGVEGVGRSVRASGRGPGGWNLNPGLMPLCIGHLHEPLCHVMPLYFF